jgi:acetylxylan esterase
MPAAARPEIRHAATSDSIVLTKRTRSRRSLIKTFLPDDRINMAKHAFPRTKRPHLVIALAASACAALAAAPARAASLQAVSNWGASGVPSYISMYIYVPDKVATNPPILVVSHYCGGSASGVFGQVQSGGIVAAADKYGFIMIFPQTTNSASSAKCWDVGSKASLTHDGGGDTQAVAQMVKYAVTTYKANADRVYATGDSSGGMMTQALLAVYPDVFKAGSSFAGVAAGCWSAGWSASSNWGGTCAGGNYTQTAQQWGDLVRGMYPGYTGHRPRVQLFHGDADSIINYKNYGESIKEWTNVLGLATSPTSTDTGLTLGSHQATRQKWQNSCGYVVLDGFTSLGGDHGPSDALFVSTYVIPFLGLDKTDAVDPEIAACGSDGGAGGAGGGTGAGGAPGSGGRTGSGGATGAGGGNGGGSGAGGAGGARDGGGDAAGDARGTGGNPGAGGTSSQGGATGGSSAAGGATGGTVGTGGAPSTGGSPASGGTSGGSGGSAGSGGSPGSGGSVGSGGSSASGGSAAGGTTSTGGSNGTGGSPTNQGTTSGGCACSVQGGEAANGFGWLGWLLFGAFLLWRRRRRSSRSA